MAVPVVTGQPVKREWSTGVFSCMEDIGGCIHGWLCSPCQLCSVANKMGENGCCIMCCIPGGAIALRTKIRTMYGIRGDICNDCLMLTFFSPCTVCQMDRELKAVGI